ncbi:MAG: DUF2130 domain-containing protein [Bacteroidia bacterium]|nr:DUF2130 domain-containing protein [Bacteroidia bacterium]
MSSSNHIQCPNCGHNIPVEEALNQQAEIRIRKEMEQKVAQQNAILFQRQQQLEVAHKQFEETKKKENELFQARLAKKLTEEKSKLTKELQSELVEKIQILENDLDKRKKENLALKKLEVQLLQKEKAINDAQEELEVKMQKTLLEKQSIIEDKVRAKEQEKFSLEKREFEKQLADQKKLIYEMQRKAEQGSMQLQGEVMEIALEDILRSEFPFDLIDEVPKGIRGADVVQTVVNSVQKTCGKIIYESKRTKAFSNGWIEKLKKDQREEGAEIAVLVTEVMPKELKKFGQIEGVWICTFSEFSSLVYVLREMLTKTQSIKNAEENKGTKMEVLYGFLTSDEFRMQVEAIVEGFSGLKAEMDKEKRAMQRIWKEREKQLEKVIGSTIDMYGSIKGIAGNAIGAVQALELPYSADDDKLV